MKTKTSRDMVKLQHIKVVYFCATHVLQICYSCTVVLNNVLQMHQNWANSGHVIGVG